MAENESPHAERISELEAELQKLNEDALAGTTGMSQKDIQRTRSQVMRRIAQRHQDDEGHVIAEQQKQAAAEREQDGS
jgi:hypothetical protein